MRKRIVRRQLKQAKLVVKVRCVINKVPGILDSTKCIIGIGYDEIDPFMHKPYLTNIEERIGAHIDIAMMAVQSRSSLIRVVRNHMSRRSRPANGVHRDGVMMVRNTSSFAHQEDIKASFTESNTIVRRSSITRIMPSVDNQRKEIESTRLEELILVDLDPRAAFSHISEAVVVELPRLVLRQT